MTHNDTQNNRAASRNRVHQMFHLSVLFLSILSLLFLSDNRPAAADDQTATYLPIQIIAPDGLAELQGRIDNAMRLELGKLGRSMIERGEALETLSSTWPPTTEELSQIAAQTGADHVAVGTLTVIGTQLSLDFKVFDSLNPSQPGYFFQEADTSASLETMVAELMAKVHAYVQRDQYIVSIAPEGNQRIDSGAILRKIKTKTGDLYDPSALREDLKAIYKMGYFNDVQIDVSESSEGKKVTFRIIEKPTISSITYGGIDELKKSDVTGVVTLKENVILNPSQVNSTAETIKALYKSKGYYNTQVTPQISYPTPDTAAVKFAIDEGKKIYVKEITFEGNNNVSSGDLEDVIKTNEWWLFSWLTSAGLLDKTELTQDVALIRSYYNSYGYLDARVAEPVITQDKEWLYIKFIIDEGKRYKMGTLDIEGDLITDKQVLLDMLSEVRDEEYLNQTALRSGILKINDYYAEQGYAFADIRSQRQTSESGNRADVRININKGELVYINRISIKGNTRTRDNVIRRDLQVAEGGVFDSKGVRTSIQKLQRLDYFEEVNVTPEPALDPSKMNILVDVKEKSTGQFSIGAGYSSVDKLVFMGEVSENNFLGLGHRLSFKASLGGKSNRYNLSWTNPRVFDSQVSSGVDLFSQEREYDDYTKDQKGGALRFGHPLYEKWRMYEKYSYTDTELSDVSEDASFIIRESQNIPITSALTATFVRDTRDRLYGATKGSRNSISIKYAGGFLGGDSEFTKAELSSGWYFPLPAGLVFYFHGAIGQAWENVDDKLPVYERFYLGGISSIRGFEYGKVSPIDAESGERVGGDRMWYTNTEIVFPLVRDQGLFGAAFFDAGDSLDEEKGWEFDDVSQSIGLEIRWLSALGPLRLVYGYNLDPDDDEPQSVWDFTIGGRF
ncbi:MAG: outer membrane protein assembly factor BamA [Desulfobulbaceae bacterium]|nr:MAG: outer membrane protein assembly factor BamA [Desulfobulbaceae bacterium]